MEREGAEILKGGKERRRMRANDDMRFFFPSLIIGAFLSPVSWNSHPMSSRRERKGEERGKMFTLLHSKELRP